MAKNTICWVITNLKDGKKLCRQAFPEQKKYIELIQNSNNEQYIQLVDQNGLQSVWQVDHNDLFADDWLVYSDEVITHPEVELKNNHLKGIVTIGYYFDEPSNSQNNYGYYKKWQIGAFKLISTDLFDVKKASVATCCGYYSVAEGSGFMVQVANNGSGQNIEALSKKLTVYIGTDTYELGNRRSISNYNNYWWDSKDAILLQKKYFNESNVGNKYEITLQFN